MKKLLLIFCLIYSGGIFAQQFGLKGGLNVSSIGGDSQGTSSKTSFHVGFFALASLSEKVKIMPEFQYSVQGASINSSSAKANYSYLNVPIMFNVYLSEKFFLQAGPQIGFLASAELSDGTNSINVKGQLKDNDFAMGLGLGIDLPSVIINARYNLGITSSSKATNGSFPNNVFQLSLGVKF